ncbi:hypothetical protein QUF58_09940 [Anaerolineales bacterium HSG24]|nr:hypothetical protein [Anaerolineales bacterium HSG24]
MEYQPNQDMPAQSDFYPESYQVELVNMQSPTFNQGFMFGCGFWWAAVLVMCTMWTFVTTMTTIFVQIFGWGWLNMAP